MKRNICGAGARTFSFLTLFLMSFGLCFANDPNCSCGITCNVCDGNTPEYMQVTLSNLQGCPDYFDTGAATAYPCFGGSQEIILKNVSTCGYLYNGPTFNMAQPGPAGLFRLQFQLLFSSEYSDTRLIVMLQEYDEYSDWWDDVFGNPIVAPQQCAKTGSGDFYCNCTLAPCIFSGSAYWRQALTVDDNCPSCDQSTDCNDLGCSTFDEYTMFKGPDCVYQGPEVIYSPPACEQTARGGNIIRTATISCENAEYVEVSYTSSAPNDVIVTAEPNSCSQGDSARFQIKALRGKAKVTLNATFYQNSGLNECIALKSTKTVVIDVVPDDSLKSWQRPRLLNGSPGNVSTPIRAGTNPLDEWPRANIYKAGGYTDIEVWIPGKLSPIIFGDNGGPAYMKGWSASIDNNDVAAITSPEGLQYIYARDNSYKINFIRDAYDSNLVEFTYDPNGNPSQQRDLSDPNYYISYYYDANGLMNELREYESPTSYRQFIITYDANRVASVTNGCGTCGNATTHKYFYDANDMLRYEKNLNDDVLYEYVYDSQQRLIEKWQGQKNDNKPVQLSRYTPNAGGFIVDVNNYIDADNCRIIREYRTAADITTKRIEYEELNDNQNEPNYNYFTQHYIYDRNDSTKLLSRKILIPPTADYNDADPNAEPLGTGREYIYDPNSGDILKKNYYEDGNAITLLRNVYEYLDPNRIVTTSPDNIWTTRLKETINVRDAKTLYTYDTNSLVPASKLTPEVNSPVMNNVQLRYDYVYDNQNRIIRTRLVDDANDAILLIINYDYDNFGNLIREQKTNSDDVNSITEYRYNAYNELIREISPAGIVTGRTYNNKAQFVSEYTLAHANDINETEPILISQTNYTYDTNGLMVLSAEAIDKAEFGYAGPNGWIYTGYEYDLYGRLTKVIADVNGKELQTTYEYNYQGELVKVTEPTDRYTQTFRNGRGLTSHTIIGYDNNDVLITQYSYDKNGNIAEQLNPDGTVDVFEYDNFDRLIRHKQINAADANLAPYTVYEYAPADELITREYDCDDNDVMLTEMRKDYDILGRAWRERILAEPNSPDDANDMIFLYTYDIYGNLLKQTGKAPASTNAEAIDEANDIIVETRYDCLGRRIKTIDGEGLQTSISYTPAGSVLTITNANGFGTVNDYDSYGRLKKVTDAEGHYTVYYYDSLARVHKQINYDCNDTAATNDDFEIEQIRFEYDNLANLTRCAIMYNPATATDINTAIDMVTDYDFNDTTGLLDRQTNYYDSNQAAITKYYYDGIARQIRTVDAAGSETKIFYDPNNQAQIYKRRQIEYSPAESYTITTWLSYDSNYGRLKAGTIDNGGSTDFNDLVTRFEYDGLDRLTKEIAPDGLEVIYEYDAFGNIIKQTEDPNGLNRIIQYQYDRLGRQRAVIGYDPNEQKTIYDYDKAGKVITLTYPDGNSIEYVYNLIGTVDEEIQRNGNSIYYGYDKLGNAVWQSSDPNANVESADFVIEFDYDAAGNLVYAGKTAGGKNISESQFLYNGFGLGSSETTAIYGLGAITIDYAYDQSGNITEKNYSDETISLTHDALGRIRTIKRAGDIIAQYTYLGSTVKSLQFNQPNITSTIDYDEIGRVAACASTEGNTILDFRYTYDDASNRTSVKYNHLDTPLWDTYEFDSLRRITKADYGQYSATEGFDYDNLGNRTVFETKLGYTYTCSRNIFNQYTKIHIDYNIFGLTGDANLYHDDNGNLSSDGLNNLDYEYNSKNFLTTVSANTQEVVAFDYDALGRRISKNVANGKTTYFYYDFADRVIAEYEEIDTNSVKLARTFVYGNGVDDILAMFLPEKSYDANDVKKLAAFCQSWLCGPNDNGFNSDYDYDSDNWVDFTDFIAFANSNELSLPDLTETQWYYLRDALGSVMGLVGNKYAREDEREFYLYDVYGRPNATSQAGNPYMFTGRRYDTETEKYYYRARYYDPFLGRFTSTDPIGYADGLNLYEYTMSNPIIFVDPYGYKSSLADEMKFFFGAGKIRREAKRLTIELWKSCRELQTDCDTPSCTNGILNSSCQKAARCWSRHNLARQADQRITSDCTKALASGTALGSTQGVLNTVNGMQDVAIGLTNLPSLAWNFTGGIAANAKIGYIPSPDWSRDLIVAESPLSHKISKALGGESAAFLTGTSFRHLQQIGKINRMTLGQAKTAANAIRANTRMKTVARLSGKAYPSKAGLLEKHHVIPKYIGNQFGIKSDVIRTIPATSHQVITNKIRSTFSYGKNASWKSWQKDEVFTALRDIYKDLPTPRSFEKIITRTGLQ